MYAVVETGGKQYKVSVGQTVDVERLEGEVGGQIVLDRVLLVSGDTEAGTEAKVGTPMLEGARVLGRIMAQTKDKKIIVFKKKRRKGYRRTQGHRQPVTRLKIEEIKP